MADMMDIYREYIHLTMAGSINETCNQTFENMKPLLGQAGVFLDQRKVANAFKAAAYEMLEHAATVLSRYVDHDDMIEAVIYEKSVAGRRIRACQSEVSKEMFVFGRRWGARIADELRIIDDEQTPEQAPP